MSLTFCITNDNSDVEVRREPHDLPLKGIKDLAPEHRRLFDNYEHFNAIQSAVFNSVYLSDESLVIGAPTASGKTTLLELAFLRLFSKYSNNPNSVKAIYIAPLKALCSEKLFEWQRRFLNLGLKCCQFTGDSDCDIYQVATHNIIITTPEKFDASSRRWRQNKFFFDQIGLIAIDEIHSVGEDRGRGGCLEALLTRCLTITDQKKSTNEACPASSMRFVALSATAPNIKEIGKWLRAKTFVFGEEYRPVPLHCHVLGYMKSHSTTYFKFDNSLNFKILDLIHQYSNAKSTLVFCSSRNGCLTCAKQIVSSVRESGFRFVDDQEQENALFRLSNQLKDPSIKSLVRNGIGVHNATLTQEDRFLIQESFVNGCLRVVCATTTLAQGVNLPAHLVIIKGTQIYNRPSGYAEHPAATIMQMIGRAGRPQFDEFGVAVIMTTTNMVSFYKSLSHRQKAVESHLSENAIEHVNAEIAMRTINSVSDAVNWMNNTFSSVRMSACPSHFGISLEESSNSRAFLNVLEKRMKHCIDALADAGMVVIKENGVVVQPTSLGAIMANYYLKLTTAKSIASLRSNASVEAVLWMLCSTPEFIDSPIRQGEKKQLNAANKNGVRYPIKGKVKELADKITILLQTALESSSNSPFQSVSLNQDMRNSIDISLRILHAAMAYLENLRDHFPAYLNCIILRKALKMRMWSDSPQVLRQIEGIGPKRLTQLVNSGITNIEQLRNSSSGKIETLCDRNPPFGNQVKQKLRSFPVLHITLNSGYGFPKIIVEQTMAEFQTKSSTSLLILVGHATKESFILKHELKLANGFSKHEIELKLNSDFESTVIIAAALMDNVSGCDVIMKTSLSQAENNNERVDQCDAIGKHRKLKHEQSLEEQSKFMRSNLQSSNKKMRMQLSPKSQPAIPRIKETERILDRLSNNYELQSNIGYSRRALGIHSIRFDSVPIRSEEQSLSDEDPKSPKIELKISPQHCRSAPIQVQAIPGHLQTRNSGGCKLRNTNRILSHYSRQNEKDLCCQDGARQEANTKSAYQSKYDFFDEKLVNNSLFDN